MGDIAVSSSEHFSKGELQCRCGCGQALMDWNFMVRLEELRKRFNKPMHVTSAYRCPEHNAAVSATGAAGPHTTGKAVDIAVKGEDAFRLLALALAIGFIGVGIKQKGPHSGRFIHLDTLPAGPGRPRPWVWSY